MFVHVRAALSIALLWSSIAWASTPVVVVIGESTTWGQRPDSTQSPTNVAVVLESLLAARPDCPYGGLAVRNWALNATGTSEWFNVRPDFWCDHTPVGQNPLLDYACTHNVPLADALIPVLAARHEGARAVLINAQGTNDAHVIGASPRDTVARIALWPSKVPPGTQVWVAPPFLRKDNPNAPIPQLGFSPARLRAFVKRVRKYELIQGILTGPDWHRIMPHPAFQADGFHLTDGGYASAAGPWLDVLCPTE